MFKPGKLKKFITLIILDGWGVAKSGEENLISSTPTPNFDKLLETYPAAVLANPLGAEVMESNSEDACRLAHFMIGTSQVESDLHVLEKINPLKITSLSRILSQNNLKQLYLADADKFAQISHFFRGCYTKLLKNEEQVLVKKNIITDYALKPELNIKQLLKELKTQLATRKFNFITINISNIDVVAHTGNRQATIEAIKITDKYLGQIVDKILNWGGVAVIMADHGKAERFSAEPELLNIHNSNTVPFLLVGKDYEGQSFPEVNLVGTNLSALEPFGHLTDIAPTILQLLSIKKPAEMRGSSLV